MNVLFENSMFHSVLFPDTAAVDKADEEELHLQKIIRFQPDLDAKFREIPLVLFDFETTGLDPREDQIIEIGAIRLENLQPVGEFSTLLQCSVPLTSMISKLTGITAEMLEGKPRIADVLPDFLDFFQGAILVAHNAEFDMGFLRSAGQKLGYEIVWPTLCTVKLARHLLPQLERRDLGFLAEHFGLTFEARHRSIGDVKVTSGVLGKLLAGEGANLINWRDFEPATIRE